MILSSSAALIDTLVIPVFPFDMKNIDPAFQRDVDTAKDCGVELIPKNQRLIAQRIRGQTLR